MDLRHFTPQDLTAVARLCEEELTLDRDAGSLPSILTRRAHIGLVAVRGSTVLGACFGSLKGIDDGGREGFIDLFVVDRAEREHGIGRRLVADMEEELASRGCAVVKMTGNPPHYAWPGIDVRYTPAICFAEDLGYERGRCVVNMEVDLTLAVRSTQATENRLRRSGIEIRRASSSDAAHLKDSLKSGWEPAWIAEITAALCSPNAGLYVALQDERCVGFCAYGVNRVGEIGPIGTEPDMRRLGIGGVLIKRCLGEQRSRGLTTADLVWVRPLKTVSRAFGATISRAFWLYKKDLAR